MARACMQNYDLEFDALAHEGAIIASGYNFGTGSSREQTAKKTPMVVAGSFSNTFARNSINNALMTLKLPRLVDKLRQRLPPSKEAPSKEGEQSVLTRRTGWTLT